MKLSSRQKVLAIAVGALLVWALWPRKKKPPMFTITDPVVIDLRVPA